MRTQSRDTSPEAERVLIGLLQKAPVTKRFDFIRSWTKVIIQMSQRNIRSQHPDADAKEIALRFVERNYGSKLAESLQPQIEAIEALDAPDLLTAIIPATQTFEQQHILYHLGGSIASSLHGMRQAAQDVDFIIHIEFEGISPLITQLQKDYAFDEGEAYTSIKNQTRFSMLHLNTLLKIDIILSKDNPYEQENLSRAKQYTLVEGTQDIRVASPEDMILVKMVRYRLTRESADDQWNDILGMLKVQSTNLDRGYLQHWASILNIGDLLKQGYVDAGIA